MEEIIQQGAEAVLIRHGDEVLKRRIPKGYRLKELDEKLRKRRTRGEARLLEKLWKLIPVPRVLKVDDYEKEIAMEFIDGLKLSETLDEMENWEEVCLEIGKNIGKLHDAGIIHGDLTTSNMILTGKELTGERWKKLSHKSGLEWGRISDDCDRNVGDIKSGKEKRKLYFIDFGLGYGNGRVEDKAVDLHLIKQALEAKHFSKFEDYWREILKSYRKESEKALVVLEWLEKVEKRGRYKLQH